MSAYAFTHTHLILMLWLKIYKLIPLSLLQNVGFSLHYIENIEPSAICKQMMQKLTQLFWDTPFVFDFNNISYVSNSVTMFWLKSVSHSYLKWMPLHHIVIPVICSWKYINNRNTYFSGLSVQVFLGPTFCVCEIYIHRSHVAVYWPLVVGLCKHYKPKDISKSAFTLAV